MAKFLDAYKRTNGIEGGYANDPKDTGGETWKGVARNKNPNWEGWVIIDKYKNPMYKFPAILNSIPDLEEAVQKLFRANYWNKVRGDELLDQDVASSIYDSAIQYGPKVAIILAQKALGVSETGKMDDNTLNKLNNK